ncbi:MAG TPA: hypothetical protein VHW65_09685, partial [Gemmatimonadales bacterium]|nr:hypothetical protein [Gemmatimonadales bacterium]
GWTLGVMATAAGGVAYSRPGAGITTADRYDAQPYARPELEATARRPLGMRLSVAVRGYAAGVFSGDAILAQRRIYAAGADPYQEMSDPFIRSVGAPLAGSACWCRWQTPGGGDLRGFDQTVSSDRLATMSVELEGAVYQRKTSALLSRAAVALFADGGALGDTRWIAGSSYDAVLAEWPDRWLGDAGVGVRFNNRIGQTSWQTRIDFPLFVSDAAYAIAQTHQRFAFERVVFSVSPVIR